MLQSVAENFGLKKTFFKLPTVAHVGKIDLKLIEADGGGKYLVHRPKRRAHKFGCNEAANLLSLTNMGTLWLNYI